jgi:amino acid adenylation domain-containing protein
LALGRGERVVLPEGWVPDWIAGQDAAAVALIDPAAGARMTFGELNARAERLARRLAGRGIGRGAVVGVSLPRSPELIVALLGVLRAGAAYLPLEPDVPESRQQFMAADAAVALVLTSAELAGEQADLPDLVGEDLAWVLYTSGSSGRPKGVSGTHLGLANRINWGRRAQPWHPGDIAIAKSRLGFVDSVCELFAPLCAGIPVVLCDQATANDPLALAQLIAREQVSTLVSVPSLLALICDLAPETLTRLRRINISGEPLPPSLAAALIALLPGTELWNIYGTTEVAADATAHRIAATHGPRVPIGRPLDNTTVKLTDPHGELVPLGVTGEIVISGHCTSPGYLGHAATDNHRFRDNAYRTGDLGRWAPDGTLEHHGRADRQLKIRGARVEPDELEHALTRHPHIHEAAVITRPTPDGPALAAFYTTTTPLDPHNLREHLTAQLPAHLIPTHLAELPELPHLPNGKLDRHTLNAQPPPPTPHPNQPPQTPTDHVVAEVFAQLTGTHPVNRHDDFFALGGHSLLATRLVSALNAHFDIELPLGLVFDRPVVSDLAEAIDRIRADG